MLSRCKENGRKTYGKITLQKKTYMKNSAVLFSNLRRSTQLNNMTWTRGGLYTGEKPSVNRQVIQWRIGTTNIKYAPSTDRLFCVNADSIEASTPSNNVFEKNDTTLPKIFLRFQQFPSSNHIFKLPLSLWHCPYLTSMSTSGC